MVADASEVRVTSRELLFGGLMEHDGQSTGVAVVGLETDRLNRGAASRRQVVTGSDLKYGDTAAAILGEGVAQQLAVAPDQGVTLLVHTTAGAEREVTLAIKGIVRTGSSFNDAYAIYVPLRFARQLLDTDGAHRLLLFLHRERDLDAVQERLYRRISETGLPLSVSSWREVQEFYDQLKSFYDILFRFAIVVVTLLSMVAIFAMTSVSFLERLRELGSLRAIGTTRGQLLLLLLVEALTTYLLGAAAALSVWLPVPSSTPWTSRSCRQAAISPSPSTLTGVEVLPGTRHHHAADDRRRRAGSRAAYRSPQRRLRPASRLKRSGVVG